MLGEMEDFTSITSISYLTIKIETAAEPNIINNDIVNCGQIANSSISYDLSLFYQAHNIFLSGFSFTDIRDS